MNKFIKYPDDLAMLVKSNVLESFKDTYLNIHDIVLNNLNMLKLDEFFEKALKKKYKKKLTIEKYGENFELYEWKDGCGRQIRNFKTIEEVIDIKEIFKDSYILYLKNNIDYTSLEILLCEIVLDENKDFIISEKNRFNLKQEKEKIIKLYNKGKEIDIKTLKNLIPENTVLCTNCKNISNLIFSTFSYKDSFEKVIDYLISLIDCRYLDLDSFFEYLYYTSESFYKYLEYTVEKDIFSEKDFANKNPYYTNKDFPNPDTIYELSEISKSIYKEYFYNLTEKDFDLLETLEKNKYIGISGLELLDKVIKKCRIVDKISYRNPNLLNDINLCCNKNNKDIKEIIEIIIKNIFYENMSFEETLQVLLK